MSADTAILEQQVSGLEARLKALRGELALYNQAKGLEDVIEAQRAKAATARKGLVEAKAILEDLRGQKARAVAKTCEALAGVMGQILPEGEAVMRIEDDGAVALAWKRPDGREIPHAGLSGGQRVLFDAALAHALLGDAKHRVLILEAAELDEEHLTLVLEHMAATNPGTQVICNSCHKPAEVPEGWDVVEVGNAA
ncbi:hypothetical protein [Solidesulfovibrio alcoholivorans]|uniref:hypothetical protein n=1 Tax=Solidesulfovibrio alcoholivorans TaxID=81406 RepID=UPI000496190F|nr:hypothetical protein [Solidesulfovibrio alcoholivorans]